MGKLRGLLQLGRIHSAPITIIFFVIAASLTFTLTPLHLFLVILIAALAHYVGFGMNGLMDWEHDLEDENKKHFEYFSINKAKIEILLAFVFLTMYTLILWFGAANNLNIKISSNR